ncbi:MAG: hypothetical protein ABIX01_19900 [Chitinophagaceae bacterium]
MPRIAGVTTQKNTKGQITHITFNLKKHEEILTPVLKQLGVVQDKTKFQKDWNNGTPHHEVMDSLRDIATKWPWKK